ncbi:hypothetical protein QEH56_20985 [Pelagicoccus enzymogenes]|uniref:baeRF3 domain-containing protein n=1 Tax=Pelagicoccus enzymogenes TaxID=2773457 RepID=UPI00280CA230|nr:hypothetical protein [Pelagicoccus enzymogenes]MDQ8200655.1 hypothetical protein [Pelagicoccus enzymogenes]
MNDTKLGKSGMVSNYLGGRSKPKQGCLTIAMRCEGGGEAQPEHAKRLRSKLREQKEKWEAKGTFPQVGDAILRQGEALAEDAEKWNGLYGGACIHLSDTGASLVKLPKAPEEGTWAGHRFRFRPAAEALSSRREFLALSLNTECPQLFHYDGKAAFLYRTFQLPRGLRDRLRSDGSIDANPEDRDRLEACFRDIAVSLNGLDDAHRLPLLLIGRKSLVSRFEESCQYPQGEILATHESDAPADEEGVARVCGAFCLRQYEAATRDGLDELEKRRVSENGALSTDVAKIVQAAESGRVALCAIDREAEVWLKRVGFDELREAAPGDGPEAFEALDCIFAEGVQKGATALVVDAERVPGGGPVAALLD